MVQHGARVEIPITVIGGYLGAGKTTLLNRLLSEAHGRRLGVIVNDFGSIGIDAELLAAASETGVVNLPNGCVCCTLGGDLMETLSSLRDADEPPDHIVIEASGIADPAVAGAWGTSAGFSPGGVVVLAAADSIARQVGDRYVSAEVRRQLAGADLLVLSKLDLASVAQERAARGALEKHAPGVQVVDGAPPTDVVLGLRLTTECKPAEQARSDPHATATYSRWSWTGGSVDVERLERLAGSLADVLRLKAVLDVGDSHREVHVVGGRTTVRTVVGFRSGSRAEAIHVLGADRSTALTTLFNTLLR